MTTPKAPAKRLGFLTRLRKDESGNIIALTAAAVLPVIAIVGGSIDVSRLYAVKTRMQAACDAGALSGRRVMGSGTWQTTAQNSRGSQSAANQMFAANFSDDFFGITSLTRNFTGTTTTVTGTVSAEVPMSLMRVFGKGTQTIAVTCTSELRIPNTDVMFVLDTTGSMNCAPADTIATCTNNGGVEKTDARIVGLRKAVNCFYESLAKVDTGVLCDSAGDPTPTGLSADIQLRVGFMPYSSNINVGKLLPTAYFDNIRPYQSITPIMSNFWVWADSGTDALGAYSAFSPATRPTSGTTYTLAANFGPTWTSTTGTGTTTVSQIGGSSTVLSNKNTTVTTSTNCTNLNTIDSKKMRLVGDVAGTAGADSLGAYGTPTYPATGHARTRTQTQTNTVTAYRYTWASSECRLQYAPGISGTNWTQTRTRTGTMPITWTTQQELTSWQAAVRSIDVSGLKNGSNWNGSLTVPNIAQGTTTVNNRSGTTGSSTINVPTSANVSWGGCIEERNTYKNIDTNPDDEWSPIPSTAIDMDIDTEPSATSGTKWGPALQDLIYGRMNSSGARSINVADINYSKINSLACPAQATRLQTWATGAAVRTYTNGLFANGGTYHDIGLLWGARFISPTGIFGATNSNDAAGNPITIQRHVVFMTDGDTGTCSSSYTPYGTSWWDRRQTNKNPPNDDGSSSCTNSYTNRITDARTAALCSAIKNQNITLWVVTFSAGVNNATSTRLRNCASSSSHFYDADNTAQLLTSFKEIALQISRLRLNN